MSWLGTLRERMIESLRASLRSFVLGPSVVQRADQSWGHDTSESGPPEYGDYIRTSNGVYTCATGRADLLASLPLKLYRGQGDTRVEVTRGRLYELLAQVNPFWTLSRLIEMTELSLCLWGQAFWFLERGESGTQPPREIWWGRPDRVRVVPDPVDYLSGYLYQPLNSTQPIPYTPGEVLWFRYPNPTDEYSGLSPLAAARVGADYATDAMRTNRNLFVNGLMPGGIIAPAKGSGVTYTDTQADELALLLERRFKGADKAHRWAVLRYDAQAQPWDGINPKDAEFLGGLKWSLEDIARAYKWPLDLIGGQRTYENYAAALRAAWTHCILPEADDLADDLTEQLLPLFPGEADEAAFDSSGVEVLHEAEGAAWTREKEQITAGGLTINEWRKGQGLKPVAWGDVWWAPGSLTPIDSAEKPVAPAPQLMPPGEQNPPAEQGGGGAGGQGSGQESHGAQVRLAYGSDEHRALWDAWIARTSKQEQALGKLVAELFRRQKDSVVARLKAERAIQDAPFDLKEWVRKFRTEVRPQIKTVTQDAGDAALDDLKLSVAFDVSDPRVTRFIEGRTQRFAQAVNETTWSALKDSLAEGIDAGEALDDLVARVEQVMDGRIRSSGETIARTEVIGASNGGTLEAWRQSGVVDQKEWVAELDDRTRDTHRDAHGQQVGLDEDFQVGDATGPGPGLMDLAEESINCRCTLVAVVGETQAAAFSSNGHRKEKVPA